MPDLPSLRSRQVVTALERGGFSVARQSGSHVMLFNHRTRRTTVVPVHARDLPMRTLRAIIKQSGLTVDEFLALL
ncbi:MAG: type II toxin-antitoxin system HicA family toxin [Dehalococcoidia bacterium]|nr:type II toxin-antitoxin system HicA family toxin [Dehalococcoidia bacterium]